MSNLCYSGAFVVETAALRFYQATKILNCWLLLCMEDNDRCGPYKTCKIAEAYNAFLSLSRGEVRLQNNYSMLQVVNVNFFNFHS